jgi:hypothetical protein
MCKPVVVCCIVVFVFIILIICKKSNDKCGYHNKQGFRFDPSPRKYLDVYDYQDFLKTHPSVYPVPYTYTTGLFKLRRSATEDELTGRRCPWIPF